MRVPGSGVTFRIPLCTVICRRCRTYKGKANEEYSCLQKGWDVKSVIIFSSSFLFHKPRFTVFPSYQTISRTVVIQTIGLYFLGSALVYNWSVGKFYLQFHLPPPHTWWPALKPLAGWLGAVLGHRGKKQWVQGCQNPFLHCSPSADCKLKPSKRTPCLQLSGNSIFNCRIITFQYSDGFCHTPTWISHRYTHVPSFLYPHSHLLPPPIPLGCHRSLALNSLHSKLPQWGFFKARTSP